MTMTRGIENQPYRSGAWVLRRSVWAAGNESLRIGVRRHLAGRSYSGWGRIAPSGSTRANWSNPGAVNRRKWLIRSGLS